MATLIVQLSDIHCKGSSDSMFARLDSLARAIAFVAIDCSHCFLVICGDLAQAGLAHQYQAIGTGLKQVADLLRQHAPHLVVDTIAIPGNHDCDFSQPFETRDVVLQGLPSRVRTLSSHSDVIELLTIPQRDFFEYTVAAGWTPATKEGTQNLYWERLCPIDNDSYIRFQCYNTAWTSTLHEIPGQLLYPVQIAASLDPAARPVAAAVSVLHHPLPWFEPATRRLLASHIERTSDIVLTGHEHVRGSYSLASDDNTAARYLESGVLQDHSNHSSASFQCLLLDAPQRRFRLFVFRWQDGLFKQTTGSDWQAFERNPTLARQAFANSIEFEDYLGDLGMAFTHPRKAKLTVQDVFIYPDLQPRGVDKDALKHRRPTASTVFSENVVSAITEHERILIAGQATSGKTTLAKSLYTDLKHKKGVVPVLLSGSTMTSADVSEISKAVDRAFMVQYHSDSLDRYRQLDRSQRAILVDDLHKSPFTRVGQQALVRHLGELAGMVICFVDDLYLLELLTQRPDNDALPSLSHFATFDTRELGWRLRGRLIGRWHRLGRELLGNDDDIEYSIAQSEDFVARLLGKIFFPPFRSRFCRSFRFRRLLPLLRQQVAHMVTYTRS